MSLLPADSPASGPDSSAGFRVRYELFASASRDIILFVRVADGRLLDANEAAVTAYGVPREELLRRTIFDLRSAEERDRARRLLAEAAEAGALMFETEHQRADGTRFPVEISATAATLGGERVMLAIVRDITERRRTEREHQAAARRDAEQQGELRFRALVENSTDVLNVFDADGVIRLWSPGVHNVLGWTEAEVVGRPIGDFLHADERSAIHEAIEALLRQPDVPQRLEHRIRTRDGGWIEFETIARNLLGEPLVRGIVTNSRDLSGQRQLQQRAAEMQKLESIGRLAGGVAHDFNNLLTAILGGADAAADALSRGTMPAIEDVEAIRTAGERARDVTRQLLSFARRHPTDPVPLDLREVLRENERMLRRLLPETIAIETALPPAIPRVMADPGQVQQVIVNLAVNARDAMPRGGTLSFELVDRPAASAASRREVRLVVRDTGEGMTDEVRAHAFEPFFTTRPQGQGTGLGLATVYGIVTQCDGRIALESAPGRGTTVTIDLPATDVEPAAPLPAEPVTGGRERVLVVEDEDLVRDLTARALEQAGYHVKVAADAEAALAAAGEPGEALDLLVTDVVMPGRTGPQLAAELRARHPGLAVLFVSGYTQDAMGAPGEVASGVEFLQKPFRIGDLLRRARGAIERARLARG